MLVDLIMEIFFIILSTNNMLFYGIGCKRPDGKVSVAYARGNRGVQVRCWPFRG